MRPISVVSFVLAAVLGAVALAPTPAVAAGREQHLLYVASPGVRNYVEHGGVGVLVFDIDKGHKFVRRIATFAVKPGEAVENVKGIAASATTGRLYVSTIKRVLAIDLTTDKPLWEQTYEGGCDRMALSPDGRSLYVPSFEGPHWTVVDAMNGNVTARVYTGAGAHNTIWSPDGGSVFLAGLKSPYLGIADARTNIAQRTVGPFSAPVRPFTINGRGTVVYANVNELLGFEMGDARTGKILAKVKVEGFEKGAVKRHGCPSHGIALTPDERELWLADAHNQKLHVFDATKFPPKQGPSIALRDEPGWITFGMDGRFAYPSTGEVIDPRTKKIVATLTDEQGRAVQSEKMVEIVFAGGKPVRAGDQFGIGRKYR